MACYNNWMLTHRTPFLVTSQMLTSTIPMHTLLQQVFHYKSTARRRLDSDILDTWSHQRSYSCHKGDLWNNFHRFNKCILNCLSFLWYTYKVPQQVSLWKQSSSRTRVRHGQPSQFESFNARIYSRNKSDRQSTGQSFHNSILNDLYCWQHI